MTDDVLDQERGISVLVPTQLWARAIDEAHKNKLAGKTPGSLSAIVREALERYLDGGAA